MLHSRRAAALSYLYFSPGTKIFQCTIQKLCGTRRFLHDFFHSLLTCLPFFTNSAQFEQVEREKVVEDDFLNKRATYAEDVRTQIKEKEKERVQARKSFFQEGIKLDQEAKERRQKLDEIKRRKLKELEEAGVPNKYVTEVARRIEGQPPALSNM